MPDNFARCKMIGFLPSLAIRRYERRDRLPKFPAMCRVEAH
jgi:hypothetical protein